MYFHFHCEDQGKELLAAYFSNCMKRCACSDGRGISTERRGGDDRLPAVQNSYVGACYPCAHMEEPSYGLHCFAMNRAERGYKHKKNLKTVNDEDGTTINTILRRINIKKLERITCVASMSAAAPMSGPSPAAA